MNRLAKLHLAAGERVDDVGGRLRPGSRPSGPAWRRPRSSRAPGPAARRCRASSAPEWSASYSRERDSAIWMQRGRDRREDHHARAAPKMLPPSSSSPPPKIAPHIAMRATNVMPIATAAATEPMRMSRLLTWPARGRARPGARPRRGPARIPCGDRDHGVLRVAAGGERVGLRRGRDVELRHRHVRPLGEVLDDGVELRRLLSVTGLAPGGLDGELVAEPVGAADEDEADDEPDDEPGLAEERADRHEQAAERGQEDGGLDVFLRIAHHL